MAIEKERFCAFVSCGLGKTLMFMEFARHALRTMPKNQCVLIVSPLMVIDQTIAETERFYNGDIKIEKIPSGELDHWLTHGDGRIGITNYEAFNNPIRKGRLGCLIIDESSMLKSHYGKWGTEILKLGHGVRYKFASTGTPAPNDRIEYANHAVFMDAFPNVNAFLATYFVNRGQTNERWVLKDHALRAFWRALSHWSIFLTNPATYGWKDNSETIPPIIINHHHVEMTSEQERLAYDQTGDMFANRLGGIGSRSVLSQIAKGSFRGKRVATHKPDFIADLVESWPDESTLIWCKFNAEQSRLEEAMPDAGSITGATPHEERMKIVERFKDGRLRTLISKPKILGFGLNLQKATRQIFSGIDDSYEQYHQAVKRSNRVGSEYPLNVHLPVTDIEAPLMENVLRKAERVALDTEEQEKLFKEMSR